MAIKPQARIANQTRQQLPKCRPVISWSYSCYPPGSRGNDDDNTSGSFARHAYALRVRSLLSPLEKGKRLFLFTRAEKRKDRPEHIPYSCASAGAVPRESWYVQLQIRRRGAQGFFSATSALFGFPGLLSRFLDMWCPGERIGKQSHRVGWF